MGEYSEISWTHATFNPWWGCTKVSAGCTNCYADTLSTRWGHKIWGPKADRRFFGDKHWAEPLKWQRDAAAAGERRRVFCASMADVFERHMIQDINGEMAFARARLWKLIESTPDLDWLLLTKRPENIHAMIPTGWLAEPRANVWYGTSVEDQAAADTRIAHLLRVPAVVRFLSCEPLLGPVDLGHYLIEDWTRIGDDVHWHEHPAIHWVIAGGESGPGARPMHPAWARGLRDQCIAAGVAYHMKQWGEWAPVELQPEHWHDFMDLTGKIGQCRLRADGTWSQDPRGPYPVIIQHLGKKAAGRLLDGVTWDQFPAVPA